jgi:hypothetical protein
MASFVVGGGGAPVTPETLTLQKNGQADVLAQIRGKPAVGDLPIFSHFFDDYILRVCLHVACLGQQSVSTDFLV